MTDIHDVDIVLVEDNPHDAALAIRALKKQNLSNKLIHLKDGQEALDFLFCQGAFSDRSMEDKPKVILLDLKMPKVDGLEVLRKIKADVRTKQIPVVMMTSSNEDRDIEESYKLGVNSYVVKPVGFENFAEAVSSLGLYWVLLNKPLNH